ncbi:dihydropteroate synthase [Tessaracoccus terricola]
MTLPTITAAQRRIGRRDFDFDNRVAVMAIVNRTKDSFFDAGLTFELQPAVDAALAAAEAGADIVDIGGVPFSPDARDVSEAEEIELIGPFIEEVAKRSDVAISVDTFRSGVARAAIAAGAAIINDTSGLHDPATAPLAAETGATLIITHSRAEPRKHLRKPHYDDVVGEIVSFLVDRVERATAAGVGMGQLIVDPGPDLNKNTLHTLEICRRFDEFTRLGPPTLAALSNKDFIGETLDRPKDQRLAGTVATTTWCIERGARIVRAHDVARTVETVRMTEALLGLREPAYLRHNLD